MQSSPRHGLYNTEV